MNYDNQVKLLNKYKERFDEYKSQYNLDHPPGKDFSELSLTEKRRDFRNYVLQVHNQDELLAIMEQLIESFDETDDDIEFSVMLRAQIKTLAEKNEKDKMRLGMIAPTLELTAPEWD